MVDVNEQAPRASDRWTRRFAGVVHAVTWTGWIASCLFFLISLWVHRRYGTLGFAAVVVAAYWAAARFGSKEYAGRRIAILTAFVVLGVVWLESGGFLAGP